MDTIFDQDLEDTNLESLTYPSSLSSSMDGLRGPHCACRCTCSARGNSSIKGHREHSDDEFKTEDTAEQETGSSLSSQPYVFVMPQAGSHVTLKDETLETNITGTPITEKKEDSEVLRELRAELRLLERALRQTKLRGPSDNSGNDGGGHSAGSRARSRSRGGHGGDAAASWTIRDEQALRSSSCFSSPSSLSSPSSPFEHVSARHVSVDTGSPTGRFSLESMEFKLKDNGKGAYYIKIGKEVMKQYPNMDINPTTMTVCLRR